MDALASGADLQAAGRPFLGKRGGNWHGSTPKILSVSLQHPDNGMEIGRRCWLTLAGQRHLVRKGAPGAVPNWHPVGASAEWRQQAQSMGWLVQMLGHPDWLEATALFESWCRQASRLSSSQLRAQAYVPDVVGQRLVSILQVLGRLPQEHDVKLYHWLRKQAYTDAQFLARAGFGGLAGWSRLSVLEGQCLFAGSFDGLRSWQAGLLPELLAEASNQWNNMERIVLVMLLSVWRAWCRFRTPTTG